jgi:hypothetical protein
MGGIMRLGTVILIVVVLLMSQTGWSQTKSLGDVAGAIKLNPEAIVLKEGVVEDPEVAKRADENLFGSLLADCSAAADLLGDLVTQARIPSSTRDLELMRRMESASFDLETEVHSISLLRLSDGFAPLLEIALQAEESCTGASGTVRDEITKGGAMLRTADAEVTRCRELLDQAKAQLVVVQNPEAAQALPSDASEPAEPLTDDEIVAARCESERAKGDDSFEFCQALQYRSQAAMASRNPGNEMLEEGIFSDIRQECLDLHPGDFVLRDGCELDRMTTARLEEQ